MRNALHEIKKSLTELFTYPVKKLSAESVDYDAYWKDKRGEGLGRLSSWQQDRAEHFLSLIDRKEPVSIMDIGCGDGSVLSYIRERANVREAYGVDVSAHALKRAEESGIKTIQAKVGSPEDAETLPEVDYILLFETLEHMADSEAFLRAVRTRAKKGVFFSFPNTGYLTHRLRLLLGKFPLQWRLSPGEHLRFWTHADLRWWMKAQGYTAYTLKTYKGVPLLRHMLPSLFAAGLFVYLPSK